VKFGVYLNTQAPPDGHELPRVYAELFETVEVAESVGFDSCFLPEHHQQPDGYLPSPYVMAGAVAARTSRIRIQTGVSLLPLWHPMRVAEDVAVIEVLSGGRFSLGVGLGLVEREYHEFGVPLRTAPSRFEEEVEILKRAWSQDTFSFHGKHFHLSDISLQPKPLPEGRPDIWIGGMANPSVQRAGRIGDGWITDPLHSMDTIAAWAEIYRAAAAERGLEGRIWLHRDCWVTETPEEVTSVWAPYLLRDWRFYWDLGFFASGRFNAEAEPWLGEVTSSADITFERIRENREVVGSVDDVVATLRQMIARIQPEGVALRFRFPHGPDHVATLAAIRLFGDQVIPQLSANTPRETTIAAFTTEG
jgi:alkanesulfonate monooxygenase SsuD/methylene tetrahydromethanopterin reductase-like flavin-dependent oxidoreductase (luciferase family)